MLLWFWDALVWLLVFFPLLTGGVWVQTSHGFFELSELAIPVLLVGALGYGLKRARIPLMRATSVRLVDTLFREWSCRLESSPRRTLGLASLFVGCFWTWVACRRHWAFGSNAADLGIFVNTISNLVFRGQYVSSVKGGMNLLIDHQSPIFFLFAPLFRIWPRAESLLIGQSLGLALGAIPLWLLAKQYLGRTHPISSLLPILYWAYLPIRNANAFDFHPDVLALPLCLGSIALAQEPSARRKWLGILFLILTLACKESASVLVFGVGLAWLAGAAPLSARVYTRFLAIVLVIATPALFYFETRTLPALLGGTYPYLETYKDFGSSLTDLVLAPIQHPFLLISRLLGPSRLKFLFFLLAPLGFVSLWGRRALLASAPSLLILFLSEGTHRVSTIYYYEIEPSVGVFWATILGASTTKISTKRLLIWMTFAALALHGRSEMFRVRQYALTPHHTWLRSELLPCIDPQQSLSTSGAIHPHLAARAWADYLPRLSVPLTGWAQCVIFDASVNNWPMSTAEHQSLDSRLRAAGYRSQYKCGSLEVFQNLDQSPGCLKCTPKCSEL